jgi:CRP/FNR family cyclic AMP-dependent transcriptional regulator
MTKTEERQFAAGQTIFREGDAARGEAFVIQSGTVAIRKQIHGEARTIRTIVRGRIFGEIALFSKAPRSADAVAEEDTRVFVIPAERLEYLVKTYPDFALDLIRDLAACVLDAEERLT